MLERKLDISIGRISDRLSEDVGSLPALILWSFKVSFSCSLKHIQVDAFVLIACNVCEQTKWLLMLELFLLISKPPSSVGETCRRASRKETDSEAANIGAYLGLDVKSISLRFGMFCNCKKITYRRVNLVSWLEIFSQDRKILFCLRAPPRVKKQQFSSKIPILRFKLS